MVTRARYARPVFAAVVLLALAGIYLVAGRGHHADSRPTAQQAAQSTRAPVTSAVRVCPAVGSAGPTAASAAVTAMPAAGSASAGSAVLTRLTPGGSTSPGSVVATDTRPGVLQITNAAVAAPLNAAQQAG